MLTFFSGISVKHIAQLPISGQLPTRTMPHHVDIGPDEWFYYLIVVWWGVVLVGSSPGDCGPGGQ